MSNIPSIVFLLGIWLILASAYDYTKGSYGLEKIEGSIVAFGDVNGDKHSDLFVVRSDDVKKEYYLDIYLWNIKLDKYIISDEKPSIMKKNPIISVTPGDFNYDGHLDVMILTSTMVSGGDNWVRESHPTTADIHIGHLKYFSLDSTSLSPSPIGEVTVIDLNNDQKPDFIGLTNANSDESLPASLSRTVWMYAGLDSQQMPIYLPTLFPLPSDYAYTSLCTGSVPSSVDLNGDCLTDLVIMACKPGKEGVGLAAKAANPLQSTDVNSDPKDWVIDSDRTWELWLNVKHEGKLTSDNLLPHAKVNPNIDISSVNVFSYSLHSRHDVYEGMQQPSFYDIDGDGTVDSSVPLCWPLDSCSEKNEIHIFANKQIPMCGGGIGKCRDESSLCEADDRFSLGLEGGMSVGSTTHTFTPTKRLSQSNNSGSSTSGSMRFRLPNANQMLSYINVPLTLQMGDANLDEHPGMLAIMTDVSDKANNGHLLHLTSVLCTEPLCGRPAATSGLYTFVPSIVTFNSPSTSSMVVSSFTSLFSSSAITSNPILGGNVYAAAFIDAGNTGNLDLMVLQYPSSSLVNNDASSDNSGRMNTLWFLVEAIQNIVSPSSTDSSDSLTSSAVNTVASLYHNTMNSDTYFLTTMMSNGVCNSWCSYGHEFPSPKPYGVSTTATTFKFTVTSLNGRKHPRQTVQQVWSSSLHLQTPYTVSGLGRTSNYIEEVFAGIGSNHKTHWNKVVAMIPNTQLVVFPYPISKPLEWTMELFISPTERLLSIVIAFLVSLALVGATMFVLRYRNRREEKKELQRHRHLFAF